MPTTEQFFKLATCEPYSYAADPGAALGSPGSTKEAGRPGPGPSDTGPAASLMVPGEPKTAPGSSAYEYGSQVDNLKNLSVVDLRSRINQ